ncbi:hypothetical protein GDO86_008436 [Hymenochirus boettgeri]|uniref:3-ketoacyl-CoA reductase n=1 Tax=Hymenochirus boettgeri TaxID=247094 RepID=A0A8T2J0D7_9PIPI|nr:hypothetical protein GDO86_008436 [Hymenochirus boettgeri]
MAAVDSFHLLFRQVALSCQSHIELLAVVGALYTAKKGLKLLCQGYNIIQLHITPHLFGKTNLVKEYGEWAVVTGATGGIAKAYAEELARHGIKIMLIDENKEKLQDLSISITETYGVNTSFMEVDFSRGREVYPLIKDTLTHMDVGLLVNCLGELFEYPQCLTLCTEEKLWETINVNISAATIMVNIVIPGMVKRKRGAIVNVSFRSWCRPTYPMSMFKTSKLYLDTFSQELQSELYSKGIFVQSLAPLCVATNGITPYRASHRFPFLVPSSEVYAHHAVKTLGVSHRTTGYWAHSVQLVAAYWFPDLVCQAVARFLHPTHA